MLDYLPFLNSNFTAPSLICDQDIDPAKEYCGHILSKIIHTAKEEDRIETVTAMSVVFSHIYEKYDHSVISDDDPIYVWGSQTMDACYHLQKYFVNLERVRKDRGFISRFHSRQLIEALENWSIVNSNAEGKSWENYQFDFPLVLPEEWDGERFAIDMSSTLIYHYALYYLQTPENRTWASGTPLWFINFEEAESCQEKQ